LVLFCNRSWHPRYGVDTLAEAFVRAARRHEGVSLILVGGGSQAHKIRQILRDGGQLDRVQFGGQVSHSSLPRWYRMADVFISPSHVDGSSVSLLEALACGIPVLVSDIPANKEWVRHGVNGWVFRDGDAGDLAEKILWIASHRSTMSRVGQAARATAEERADWSKNFKVLLRSYRRTLEAP
jgi:glycosyltransferase involved in cell wall biosynthesis